MHDLRVARRLVHLADLAALKPSGFSHMMCLPARAAATAIGRWVSLGVAMTTASIWSDSQRAMASVVACSTPHSRLRFSSSDGSASQIATRRARGSSRSPAGGDTR